MDDYLVAQAELENYNDKLLDRIAETEQEDEDEEEVTSKD